MRRFFLYTVALIVLFTGLNGCIQYKEVEVVKVGNIDVKNFSANGIDVAVEIQIKNPNKYKIQIMDADLILHIGDKRIGKAHVKEKVVLPKKSNQMHQFTVQTQIKELGASAIPLFMSLMTKKVLALKVKGDIKAKAKGISKKVPIDISENVRL